MKTIRRHVTFRRVMALLGVGTIVFALVYTLRPVGHIPLYDANLVRLAETPLQGYCAGETLWVTGGAGSADTARACRAERADTLSDEINVAAVLGSFCKAIMDAGWEGTRRQCLDILSSAQYWPTYDGNITDQWNRARPYPVKEIAVGGKVETNESRTGDRPKQQRQEDNRGDRGYREGAR